MVTEAKGEKGEALKGVPPPKKRDKREVKVTTAPHCEKNMREEQKYYDRR